jgi:hypothetical protein
MKKEMRSLSFFGKVFGSSAQSNGSLTLLVQDIVRDSDGLQIFRNRREEELGESIASVSHVPVKGYVVVQDGLSQCGEGFAHVCALLDVRELENVLGFVKDISCVLGLLDDEFITHYRIPDSLKLAVIVYCRMIDYQTD